jgi:uncharacterized protein YgiM (DUF1202 family)
MDPFMLRLTLLLCIGMFAALMIAGQDRGQLRPGLADAAARRVLQGSQSVTAGDSADATLAEDVVVAAPAAAGATKPPVVARAEPEPYVEPVRDVVAEVEEPVFSLASAGNEAVPGAAPTPEVVTGEGVVGGAGTIWYVNANSVNVRSEPSTDAEVVGRLGSGEATLVVQAVDDDWARIVIQGDGVEGFVALRYLSPEAP